MKSDIAKIIKRKKKAILESWLQLAAAEESLAQELISNDELREQSDELLNAFAESITDANLDQPNSEDFAAVSDKVASMSISRAKQGFTPRETGLFIFALKDAILQNLAEDVTDATVLYKESMRISKLLDSLTISSFEHFIKGREEVILRQTDEITEISTPVIRVWDGILALPIIGTLDSSRTQTVMENLLQQIVETGSTIAILDISGVPAVDSLVAQHLIKTVSATRLMGAECIISGIRPEIAQTVVHLGIDLSNIATKATLASALKTAFTMLQLSVEKKNKA